jgi:hypothetical protein
MACLDTPIHRHSARHLSPGRRDRGGDLGRHERLGAGSAGKGQVRISLLHRDVGRTECWAPFPVPRAELALMGLQSRVDELRHDRDACLARGRKPGTGAAP